MKALIDTCIIVDALQNREPFCKSAQSIFLLCANKQFEGFLTAKSITDVYYLTHRQTHNDVAARDILLKLCELFCLLDITASDIQKAILADTSDFEDAVMIETAKSNRMDCIVTRNIKGYSKAPLPIYKPEEFTKQLSELEEKDK